MTTAQVEAQSVFDWDSVSKNWHINEESFDKDFPTSPFLDSFSKASVARWIVEDVFSLNVSKSVGGKPDGYDMRSRDA